MDMKKVGRYITQRRKSLGYTQEELGQRLNVTGKAVSKWERGISCPDVTLINRLAVELKVSVLELLNGAENHAESSSFKQIAADGENEGEETVFYPRQSAVVSPYLFGSNLEHTRSDITAGLSAQMLRNRKFAGKPSATCGCAAEWFPIGELTAFFLSPADAYTRHAAEHYHMNRKHECNAVRVVNFHPGQESGIGQHGLFVQKDRAYEGRVVVKSNRPVTLTFALTNRSGTRVYASATFSSDERDWSVHAVQLTCPAADPDAALRVSFAEEACVWFGAVSLMPTDHFHGMRRDVIEALRHMGIRVLRWPGGNFAGEYNWLDGLLPADMRAPFESALGIETQPHSMGYDFHEINTDDFVALCREIGAEPYITINPAWNTPEESAAWVEYCNGDQTTKYGALRAERGCPEPYSVQLWSLGNEFGYGHMEGDNTPQGYRNVVRRHAEAMKKVCGNLSLCSSGPYPDPEWAKQAALPLGDVAPLVSMHYYAPERVYADREQLREDYLRCIDSLKTVRGRIRRQRELLGDALKISFDEWNTWYAWYRPSCVTDGIFTALMLNLFIGEAEHSGIAVVCHFEAVNEGAIRVTPQSAELTATGQAFSVMKHHANGILCYASETVVITKRDGVVTVTAVNPSYDQVRVERFDGAHTLLASQLYWGRDVLPHSVFECLPAEVSSADDGLCVEIPPHSLVLLQMRAE